jgi:hypothetical protein
LGVDASLTLGNKKTVDIFVARENGTVATIDVKGVAGRYDWPADNIRATETGRHFVALVSYNGKIDEPGVPPDVWIMPHSKLQKFVVQYKGRKNVSRARITHEAKRYRDNWKLIIGRS